MTLLLGAITALMIQFIKWLIGRIGKEFARLFLIFLVFIVSLAFTILKQKGVITLEMMATVVQIFTAAIATYEIIFKTLLLPIWNKFFSEE